MTSAEENDNASLRKEDASVSASSVSAGSSASLLDLVASLAKHKTLIVRTALVMTLLGVVYALAASEEYTSNAQVVREAQENASAGLSSIGGLGALRGLGFSLGGMSNGLSVTAFPNVLQSREVRLAVVRDTFSFPDEPRPMTFVEYVSRPPGWFGVILKYTLRLPWTLKAALLPSDPPSASTGDGASDTLVLTEAEAKALEKIQSMVSVSVNDESGLMTIAVTAGSPELATVLTKRFIDHLSARVREIRTENVTDQLGFVEERFKEAEGELKAEEEELAQFLERNQNPTTAFLRFQRDRLQRQVSFKEQLSSEIQSQLTKTRVDLQRRQPVLTVVEEPVAPLRRSWPARSLIVVLSLIFGAAAGVGGALLIEAIKHNAEPGDYEKLMHTLDRLGLRFIRNHG